MAPRIATLLATVALTLLLTAAPAQAHGGASVTIHSDGRGSVWITAQWQDGHPISEPTTVTLTASGENGKTQPPSVLHQTGDERGTQTFSGTLDPGAWRGSIDLGAPVNGHCQAPIQSAPPTATPLPTEVACLIPATGPSAAAPAPQPPSGGSLAPLWYTLGALAVAAALTTALIRRRRTS